MEIKRVILGLTVTSALFLSHFSKADQTLDEELCTTRDVSQNLGDLRDQGNIGWCYANVAADLLTFQFHKELYPDRASAGYVALTFNQFAKLKPRPDQDSGLISPAVFFSQRNGLCKQSFQDKVLANSPFKTIKEQIQGLVELKTQFDAAKGTQWVELDIVKKYRASNSYINRLSTAELMGLLRSTTNRTFPRRLAEKLCEGNLVALTHDAKIRFQEGFIEGWKNLIPDIIFNLKLESPKKIGARDLIREMHEELNNYNMVAMSYNINIFSDSVSEAKKLGLHASSVVGRRWDKNTRTCDFKLRNSWGKTCAPYVNPELKGKCESKTGYVWVPDILLQKAISDIVYYKTQ